MSIFQRSPYNIKIDLSIAVAGTVNALNDATDTSDETGSREILQSSATSDEHTTRGGANSWRVDNSYV